MEPKKRTASIIGTAFVGVMVVVGWVAVGSSCREDSSGSEPAWIAEAGYTLDPGEWDRRMAVPDVENAAPLMVAISPEFDLDSPIAMDLRSDDPLSACLDRHSSDPSIYLRLKEIAAKASAHFERDWSNTFATPKPEMSVATKGARFLSQLAKNDIKNGDYAMAEERFLVADRVASHLGSEDWDSIISQFGARRAILQTLGDVLVDGWRDPRVLDLVEDVVVQSRSKPDLELAMQGHMMATLLGMRQYNLADFVDDYDATLARGSGKNMPPPSFQKEAEEHLLEAFRKEFLAIQLPTWPERIKESERLFHELKALPSAHSAYLAVVLPMNASMYERAARDESYFKMLRLLPEILASIELDGLDVSVAKFSGKYHDPASTAYLRVTATEVGFKLYSVGFDGTEDGGPKRVGYDPGNGNEKGYDFGFWIPLAED